MKLKKAILIAALFLAFAAGFLTHRYFIRGVHLAPCEPAHSEIVTGVLSAFLLHQYEQQPGNKEFLDRTIYILAEGIPDHELRPELYRTKFQYIQADQADNLAAQTGTEVRPFVYFHLAAGEPTSEGWRTLHITDCAIWPTPNGLKRKRAGGIGAASYAEVPIQGEFTPVAFSGFIAD